MDLAVIEPRDQLPVPVVAGSCPSCPPRPPASPRDQLPVPVAAGSIAIRPVGGHWPVWCVSLAIQLVRRAKLSLRSIPEVLKVVLDFILGRVASTSISAWTTVRRWLLRLGLYALSRPLERTNDWAYLIDHTVQIGTVKCLAMVGIRLSQLPYPGRCLQREDMVLIALVPMEHSTALKARLALDQAELRTGVPRLIVSDEGGDVRGGIESYCGDHPHTSSTCDMAHKGANLLRTLLEADARWSEFTVRLGQTKAKLQQTPLACCIGPSLRPKARFMNLAAPLRWARWCLRVLDGPWPANDTLTERQRLVLETIDRTQLEAKLGWLKDDREAIKQWSEWHEVIQAAIRQVRRYGIEKGTAGTLEERFRAMKLSSSGRAVADHMLVFVRLAATVVRGGECLIGSTEILESLFGDLKTLERQQSGSGLTGLMLGLGAIMSTWSEEEIKKALETIPLKAAEAWVAENLGPTLQSQRRTLGSLFTEA